MSRSLVSQIICIAVSCALSGAYSLTTSAASPSRQFAASTPAEADQWQTESRTLLFELLKLSDLVAERQKSVEAIPFEAKTLSITEHDAYSQHEIEFNSTPTRRIKAVVTYPKSVNNAPAVVCIHGHGGNRDIVYDEQSVYRGFAKQLASNGFVTISTDVGQHEVYEEGRTLMGERLWDVMRCADYLTTLEEVDDQRLGCAGLSLGGEMAMWLGAMDPRMKAVVSSGFLTTVANLRDRHCQCWDFPGFTENFGFRDVYSLTAPRPLLCQIGRLERAPGGFPPEIAEQEIAEIQEAYRVFGKDNLAVLTIHPEGHVYDVPDGNGFLASHLKGEQAQGN